jgi:hypothetical protein
VEYEMGFGANESTFKGIAKKLFAYGRMHAGILKQRRHDLKFKSVEYRIRILNRMEMLGFTILMVAIPGAYLIRALMYAYRGSLRYCLLGPLLDFVYTSGFIYGILKFWLKK